MAKIDECPSSGVDCQNRFCVGRLCLSRDRAEAGNSEYQRNTGEEVDLVEIVVNKLSCEEKARDWIIPRRNFRMTGVC